MWFKTVKSNGESAQAIKDAKKHLNQIKARDEEVKEVTQEVRGFRFRNHFGLQVDQLVRQRIERELK